MDWTTIRESVSLSRFWHLGGWSLLDLAAAMRATVVSVDLDPAVFGAMVSVGEVRGISINAQLAGAGYTATLAHELGHAIQPGTVAAFCSSTLATNGREREAHVLAAIFTVPLAAIATVDLWSDEHPVLADELLVPSSYVHMRNALAVVLGEKRGEIRDARAILNGALLAHQCWMEALADELKRARA